MTSEQRSDASALVAALFGDGALDDLARPEAAALPDWAVGAPEPAAALRAESVGAESAPPLWAAGGPESGTAPCTSDLTPRPPEYALEGAPAPANGGARLSASPVAGSHTETPSRVGSPPCPEPAGASSLPVDELLIDLPEDPLATVDELLLGAGIGTGRDFRDIVDILPPSLLMPRLLWRCLPGLEAAWPRFRLFITDVLHSTGRAIAADPADALRPLLTAPDVPPPIPESWPLDAQSLLWYEVTSLRLLTPAEHRQLGHWIAEARLIAELLRAPVAARDPGTPAQRLAHAVLRALLAALPVVRPFLSLTLASAAAWRASLVRFGVKGVSEASLAEVAGTGGAVDELRATLRRAETALRLLPAPALTALSEAFYAGDEMAGVAGSIDGEVGPTPAEVRERGAAAVRLMLQHNLRLVFSIVRTYAHATTGMEPIDLVQEGSLGLLRAVEGWEPARGFTFSTYATWWIQQALTRAIADKGRLIRLPVHVHEKTDEAWQSVSLARPPADRERWLPDDEGQALTALVRSGDARDELRDCLRTAGIAPKQAGRLAGVLTIESLDDDTICRWLAERLPDETDGAGSETDRDTRALRQALDDVLSTLNERERRVVELRYGLDGDDNRTLGEIGRMFGVTRERIRQIEEKAMRGLQHPVRARRLAANIGEPSLRPPDPRLRTWRARGSSQKQGGEPIRPQSAGSPRKQQATSKAKPVRFFTVRPR